LPSLLATGQQGRPVWAIYAFLPLIWLPAGVAIAALNNYLLPLFTIVLGVALARWRTEDTPAGA
jgi:hypothetical protein